MGSIFFHLTFLQYNVNSSLQVTGIDVQAKNLQLDNGESLHYDKVMFATGGRYGIIYENMVYYEKRVYQNNNILLILLNYTWNSILFILEFC